ncbi:MAG: MmcQ/YjbR family DNA-binding protein [Bradyrhizobium sp.]
MSANHFRKTALALAEAVESSHHGKADFRVGNRIFATLGHPDENWGTLKLTAEQQSMLVDAEPEIFRPVPGGWGRQGYTNVRLAKADVTTLKSAMAMAWENVAPKPKAPKVKAQKATAKARVKSGARTKKP